MTVPKPQAISLCLVTDGKAGHYSQLKGFAYGLGLYALVEEQCLDISEGFGSTLGALRKLPKNTLVAGAGGSTWRYLLIAKKILGLRTIVLMKPRLWPFSWFDLVVAPKHDGIKSIGNIIATEGVLSTIEPAQSEHSSQGLILVGGPSKHHHWDNAAIVNQIKLILKANKRDWTISTSRRTPKELLPGLKALENDRVDFVPVTDTPPNWVRDQLANTAVVWVSEDSMSMVFEGLSAGIPVGLLSVPRQRSGRVTRCIDDLIERQWLTSFSHFEQQKSLLPTRPPLQEAARVGKAVAEWLGKSSSEFSQ